MAGGERGADLAGELEEAGVLGAQLALQPLAQAEARAGALPPVEIATARSPRRTTAGAMKLEFGRSSTEFMKIPRRRASSAIVSASAGERPAAMTREAPARSPGR